MLNLYSPPVPGNLSAWRLFLALFVAAGLHACSNSRAPDETRAGAEPPPPPAAAAPAPRPPPPAPAPAPATRPPGPAAANGSGSHWSAPKTAVKPIAGETSASIPQFDWPPPKASAEQSIPDKWLRTGPTTRLADVADKFEKALRLAHYEQRSYYAVPHGFALATQLEQIKADGTPMPGADRWKIGTPSVSHLSLASFIKALAKAPAGNYRAIVFVVTDAPWVQSTAAPSDEKIKGWAGGGAHALPASIGALPYGADYRARALIYEFRKGQSGPAKTMLPSAISGEMHLDKGGIWEPLSIL
jgi:hypothetical protein